MTYSENSWNHVEHARYEHQTGAYHLRDNGSDERLSTNIALALAEITESDPLQMDPLYERIDPDVLDSFVERAPRSGTGELSFVAQSHRITVHMDGHVVIRPERLG